MDRSYSSLGSVYPHCLKTFWLLRGWLDSAVCLCLVVFLAKRPVASRLQVQLNIQKKCFGAVHLACYVKAFILEEFGEAFTKLVCNTCLPFPRLVTPKPSCLYKPNPPFMKRPDADSEILWKMWPWGHMMPHPENERQTSKVYSVAWKNRVKIECNCGKKP